MFLSLFKKECQMWLKSFIYYFVIALMLLFCVQQMQEDMGTITKPEPGMGSYGTMDGTDPSHIMERNLIKLVNDYVHGYFITYPFGFYKEVHLDSSEMKKIAELIMEMSDSTAAESTYIISSENVTVSPTLTYDVFLQNMDTIDHMLGGHSEYAKLQLAKNAPEAKSYEQAMREYEEFIHIDHVSRAYARLFCDYMGIFLSVLPVFLSVTRTLKDKRSKVNQVIYTKKANTVVIVLSRYLAALVMVMIPVLILSCMILAQCLYIANANGVSCDLFVFLKYSLGWLMPSVMVSLGMGFLITELTESVLALLVQGVWWYTSLITMGRNLTGDCSLKLIPRFNELGATGQFAQIRQQLIYNRIMYAGIGIVLIVLTMIVYDKKRKGGFCRGKVSKAM